MSDLPEADRLACTPHPRHTLRLHGQDAAMAQIAQAISADRLHHGWLIAGPPGIGKATLAWAMARVLLTRPASRGATGGLFGPSDPEPVPADLHVDPGHPVVRRLGALTEPRLALVRRPWDDKARRLRADITVDEIRRLKAGFALSGADDGWRVALVDAADDMNPSAANALLKLLEEPPRGVILILVSHRPARLLPTIRSRCRVVRCSPLGAQDLARALAQAGVSLPEDPHIMAALTRLAEGSVGTAAGLVDLDGLSLYRDLTALIAGMPGHDRPAALALARALAPPDAAERRALALTLTRGILRDLSRAGITGTLPVDLPPEIATAFRRLSHGLPAARLWAEAEAGISARLAHGLAVNLDPQGLILDMLHTLDTTASRALSQIGAA